MRRCWERQIKKTAQKAKVDRSNHPSIVTVVEQLRLFRMKKNRPTAPQADKTLHPDRVPVERHQVIKAAYSAFPGSPARAIGTRTLNTPQTRKYTRSTHCMYVFYVYQKQPLLAQTLAGHRWGRISVLKRSRLHVRYLPPNVVSSVLTPPGLPVRRLLLSMTLPRPVTESYSRRVGLRDPSDIMCMHRSFGRCRFSMPALKRERGGEAEETRRETGGDKAFFRTLYEILASSLIVLL